MLRDALPDSLQIRSAAAADDAHRALERAQDAQRAMRACRALSRRAGKTQTKHWGRATSRVIEVT